MPRTLHVHLLPALTSAAQLARGTVVVIDVLRASTTIVHALEAGAAAVQPFLTVDEVRARAAELNRDNVLLSGERKALPIEGFDLGNSPAEYTPQRLAGRTVLFTTTNGTRAMQLCGQAQRTLVGSFVNAAAVAESCRDQPRVHLLCAGTAGAITREDTLFAGLLVVRLTAAASDYALNDEARLARDAWRACFADDRPAPAEIVDQLRDTQGGRNLAAVGLSADLQAAAALDRTRLLPVFDPATGEITPA